MSVAGTWEAENGDAEGRRSGSSASLKDGPWGKGSKEDEQNLYAAPPIRKEPWRLSHLMILIVVVAVLLWVWVTLGMLSILFGVLGAIVLAITIAFVAGRMRATRRDALLSILAIAADRDVPLAPAVAAFADQFGGRSQRRVLNVAAEIHGGTLLAEALERPRAWPRAMRSSWPGSARRPGCSPGRCGWPARTRAVAGRRVVGHRLAARLPARVDPDRPGHLGIHPVFVVPQLEAIFTDFRHPLAADHDLDHQPFALALLQCADRDVDRPGRGRMRPLSPVLVRRAG